MQFFFLTTSFLTLLLNILFAIQDQYTTLVQADVTGTTPLLPSSTISTDDVAELAAAFCLTDLNPPSLSQDKAKSMDQWSPPAHRIDTFVRWQDISSNMQINNRPSGKASRKLHKNANACIPALLRVVRKEEIRLSVLEKKQKLGVLSRIRGLLGANGNGKEVLRNLRKPGLRYWKKPYSLFALAPLFGVYCLLGMLSTNNSRIALRAASVRFLAPLASVFTFILQFQ